MADPNVPVWTNGAVTIPLPFASPEFQASWGDWCQHRREKRCPLTPGAVKKAFAELAGWGELRAVHAIGHSIARSYQGIYEPKDAARPRASRAESILENYADTLAHPERTHG